MCPPFSGPGAQAFRASIFQSLGIIARFVLRRSSVLPVRGELGQGARATLDQVLRASSLRPGETL